MKIKVNGEEKKIELDKENALLSTALNLMGYKPNTCLLYTSPSPRDTILSRMPSSA